jgi:hypothetical protein
VVVVYSKEDGGILQRICAPMDCGPSRRAKRKNDRFHLWDYDSDTQMHTLSLNPKQVLEIEILPNKFDPAEFVTWVTDWIVPRNWGVFS